MMIKIIACLVIFFTIWRMAYHCQKDFDLPYLHSDAGYSIGKVIKGMLIIFVTLLLVTVTS